VPCDAVFTDLVMQGATSGVGIARHVAEHRPGIT
jgi:hypothetical protein